MRGKAPCTSGSTTTRRLDRLSANAAFLLTLGGVRFAAVDLPEAHDLTVGTVALVAQQDGEAISRRTKEALAVARSRGVRLGNPNGAARPEAGWQGRCAAEGGIAQNNAERHARDLAPVVADIRSGAKSRASCMYAACLPAVAAVGRLDGGELLDRLGLAEVVRVPRGGGRSRGLSEQVELVARGAVG